jgi:hypothetical protein
MVDKNLMLPYLENKQLDAAPLPWAGARQARDPQDVDVRWRRSHWHHLSPIPSGANSDRNLATDLLAGPWRDLEKYSPQKICPSTRNGAPQQGCEAPGRLRKSLLGGAYCAKQ